MILLVHIVLVDLFFLFLVAVVKKMRNLQELMQRRAKRMFFKKERGLKKFREPKE